MNQNKLILPQDLHIHTIFSSGDSAVVPEQTIEFIANLKHAKSIGISDHLECLIDDNTFDEYEKKVIKNNFHLGIEVNGHQWVNIAEKLNVEYYIYHCCNIDKDYAGIEILLSTGKPVIIAHPHALETDLSKVPTEAIVEINNRYIWRCNWIKEYQKYVDRFKFVISSDAHQPHWLNQNIARYAAQELGIKEHLLFN